MANGERPTTRTKAYLIPGIAIVCLLAGGLMIWFQTTGRAPRIPVSTSAALQINVPTTPYPTVPASAPAFTVPIRSTDASGITGTVTFKEIAGSVAILLHVDGLPEDQESEESVMPVELRSGSCAAPGALAYPLAAPDAGESETDLAIDLQQFNAQKPMAVILYRSPQDHTVVACGDIR